MSRRWKIACVRPVCGGLTLPGGILLSLDSNWSDPLNWRLNGAVPGAGQYPGMPGSANDVVQFDQAGAPAATLNVGVNPLQTLVFDGWANTLTLNNSLLVTGAGAFALTDGSTITMAANTQLCLGNLAGVWVGGAAIGINVWTNGTIGGAAGSTFLVSGSTLQLADAAVPAAVTSWTLGTEMVVQASPATGVAGNVVLSSMTGNLTLSIARAYIDVGNGGTLSLAQTISAPGRVNVDGGIVAPFGEAGRVVQVEAGGTLNRQGGTSPPGTINQVQIQGAIYNLGGTVSVVAGSLLNITANDSNGDAYWQERAGTALLQVGSGGNIAATGFGNPTGVGTFEIDAGTLQFTAPSGGTADELDAAGLTFGGTAITSLVFVDSTLGTPGTVTVQGPVTLGITKTMMNFTGGNNTADRLDDTKGALTVGGFLNLTSRDRKLPTQALNFFDDSGPAGTPAIDGGFAAINDNINPPGTDTGAVVKNNAQLLYFAVSFAAPPKVIGMAPNSGPTTGGTAVVISGSGLSGATAVAFGGVAATSFVVNSDGSITAVAPAEGAGPVDVTVTTPWGTSAASSADQFTYLSAPVVAGINPSSGSTAGGSSVRIGGTGLSGATGVAFGGVAATSFVVNGDGSITAVAPAGAAGTVDVTVTTGGGTSATSSADRFTYVAPPVVTGISPSSGPASGGTVVTIWGTGLSTATGVWFGSVAATSFMVNLDGSITVVAPPSVAGTVDVTVATLYGTSATSSADEFTYT